MGSITAAGTMLEVGGVSVRGVCEGERDMWRGCGGRGAFLFFACAVIEGLVCLMLMNVMIFFWRKLEMLC